MIAQLRQHMAAPKWAADRALSTNSMVATSIAWYSVHSISCILCRTVKESAVSSDSKHAQKIFWMFMSIFNSLHAKSLNLSGLNGLNGGIANGYSIQVPHVRSISARPPFGYQLHKPRLGMAWHGLAWLGMAKPNHLGGISKFSNTLRLVWVSPQK